MRRYIAELELQRQKDAERLQQGFDDALHKHRADIARIAETMSSLHHKLPVLGDPEYRQALDDVFETDFYPNLAIQANQELDRMLADAERRGEELNHEVVVQDILRWYEQRNLADHQHLQNAGDFLLHAHDNEVLRYKSMLRDVKRKVAA